MGYSVAGAERRVLVVGLGARMLGSSFSSGIGSTCLWPLMRGPVRTAEGRICSNPWEAATFSMDLKYCGLLVTGLVARKVGEMTNLDGLDL